MDNALICPRCDNKSVHVWPVRLHTCYNFKCVCTACGYQTPDYRICIDEEDACETWKKHMENPLVRAFWHAEKKVSGFIRSVRAIA